jgi:hypothetical protein
MAILTPLVNFFVVMGASVFSANICIIACVTLGCMIFGAAMDTNSFSAAKVLGLFGLIFSTVLVLAEYFPWLGL